MSASASTDEQDCRPQARPSFNATPSGPSRADIDAALRPRAPLLTLPPDLEARYEAATWHSRGRNLRAWLFELATLDLMCIGIDAITMP